MHRECMDFLNRVCPRDAMVVIELGSRDVNGTPRGCFPVASRTGHYTGVDIEGGPGVDIVADASSWTPPFQADAVVCCEVLEHTADWPAIVRTAVRACAPGGTIAITAAGKGRAPHSAVDGGPLRDGEYYGNIESAALNDAFLAAAHELSFSFTFEISMTHEDIRLVARRIS